MTVKRKVVDLICSFLVFAIVLVSIAALTGESFFEGAVEWNGDEASLSVFGTEFLFDKNLLSVGDTLLHFNDIAFGREFSRAVKCILGFVTEYAGDGISVAYGIARDLVGG